MGKLPVVRETFMKWGCLNRDHNEVGKQKLAVECFGLTECKQKEDRNVRGLARKPLQLELREDGEGKCREMMLQSKPWATSCQIPLSV